MSAGLGYRGSLQVVNQIAPADGGFQLFRLLFHRQRAAGYRRRWLSSCTNMTVADIALSCTIAAFAVIALIFGLAYRH
jgi:hypothetical protein